MALCAVTLRRARLGVATWLLEALQQVLEAVGNALAQHLVVDALKDVTDPSLILATRRPPGLLTCASVCMVASDLSGLCVASG